MTTHCPTTHGVPGCDGTSLDTFADRVVLAGQLTTAGGVLSFGARLNADWPQG